VGGEKGTKEISRKKQGSRRILLSRNVTGDAEFEIQCTRGDEVASDSVTIER
jgi:hypothetical protein